MYPILFSWGPVTIHSFGVMVFMALVTMTFVVWEQARKRGISEERVFDTLFLAVAAFFLVGRAVFALTHGEIFGSDFGRAFLLFKYPGISVTGGFFGAMATVVLAAKAFELRVLEILDSLSFGVALAMVFGSLGCFLDGCLGRVSLTPVFMAVIGALAVGVLWYFERQLLRKAELGRFYRQHGIFALTYLIFLSGSFLMLSYREGYGQREILVATLLLSLSVFLVRYWELVKMIKFPSDVLAELRKHLERRGTDLEKQIKELKKEDPFEDKDRLMDAASEDSVAQSKAGHEKVAALSHQLNIALIQTKKALTKIKIGRYGICENCGKMIDTDRLAVMPTATYCMDCEKKRGGK